MDDLDSRAVDAICITEHNESVVKEWISGYPQIRRFINLGGAWFVVTKSGWFQGMVGQCALAVDAEGIPIPISITRAIELNNR
jgi:hypothetical protein